VVDYPGCFTWYELITTDMSAAKAFYAEVVGWGAQEASTADLSYSLFTAGTASIGGLMDLPEEARKMGARPRWIGYVSVDDVDVVVTRIKHLGGAVFVQPTNSNIGRIAVIADPQMATLALVKGLKHGQRRPTDRDRSGRVGWHELFAADWEKAFAFYGEIFGWQRADAEIGPSQTYQLFSASGQTIGGMFTKNAVEPVAFWLYYFNVNDIDAAAGRVKAAGGEVSEGPLELSGGIWIARCTDPQGAAFALQGKRSQDSSGVGWSSEWSGISSRGRLVSKPRG
jgi:hypothetical protein